MNALITQLENEERILKHKLDTVQEQILKLKAKETLPDVVGKYIKIKLTLGVGVVYMKVTKTLRNKNGEIEAHGPSIIVERMLMKTNYTFSTLSSFQLREGDFYVIDEEKMMKIINEANNIFSK